MELQSPGPILSIGTISIRWYILCTAAGFIAAAGAATILLAGWGYRTSKFLPGFATFFIGGLVGARLYYVALCWQKFLQHPSEIFTAFSGGRSIQGGIIGGIIAALIFCRITKFPFLLGADITGSVLPLGQAIGRLGNFFNSEAFGQPVAASFPLKLSIPESNRPLEFCNENFFHPTFLYESVWNLGIFAFLYFFAVRRLRNYPGMTFLLYVILYSVGRIPIESLRIDSISFNGIPAATILSIITIAAGLMGIKLLLAKGKRLDYGHSSSDRQNIEEWN